MFIMGQNIYMYIYHRVRLFKLVFILKSPRFLVKTMFLIATTADVFYGTSTHKTLVTLVTIGSVPFFKSLITLMFPCSKSPSFFIQMIQNAEKHVFHPFFPCSKSPSFFILDGWIMWKKMPKKPIDPAPVAWHPAAGNGERNAHLTRTPPGVTLGKGHQEVLEVTVGWASEILQSCITNFGWLKHVETL